MSVVVCGKRSSSIFADDLLLQQASPPHHSPAPKCQRYSHHHRRDALLAHLRAAFPAMDPQLLERALDASGDDLDDAIKSLKELHLMESNQANLSATGSAFENGPTAVQPSVEEDPYPNETKRVELSAKMGLAVADVVLPPGRGGRRAGPGAPAHAAALAATPARRANIWRAAAALQ